MNSNQFGASGNRWVLALLVGFFLTLQHAGMTLLGIPRSNYNMLLTSLIATVAAQLVLTTWPKRP
ncbi:hypothetical protein FHR71_002044 [Methylobacterium sp. RAS18]|nr:hypothetical protein [Methylobacterium sp. RAS18]